MGAVMDVPGSEIIRRFNLSGTLLERLIEQPRRWTPASLNDSPDVMRYAMDLRQALLQEGWKPPVPLSRRRT